MQRNFSVIVALLVITCAGRWAMAQPLVDLVPQDVVLYVGWRGIESAGPAYGQSNLGRLVVDAGIGESVAQIRKSFAIPHRDAIPMALFAAGEAAWRHPTAAWLRMKVSIDGEPMPLLTVVWQAGACADELINRLRAALPEPMDEHTPVLLQEEDGRVVLAIGYANDEPMFAGADGLGPSLTADVLFREAVGQGQPEAMLIAFFSAHRLLSVVHDAVAETDAAYTWRQVRSVLGMDQFQYAVHTAGFSGAQWSKQTFIKFPEPRPGLGVLLESEPITPQLLALVPVTATFFDIGRLNLVAFFDELRRVMGQAHPHELAQMDAAIAEVKQHWGIDLEADVIRALGSEWIVFTEPSIAGPGSMGIGLVHPLRDAAAFSRTLATLQAMANEQAAQLPPGVPQLRIQSATLDDMTIHSLAMPMFSPSWSVHDGRLYGAMFPQAVPAVRALTANAGGSILDNEKFIALRRELGIDNEVAIGFVDLPQTAPPTYQNLLMMTQMVTGMIAMQGGPALTILLPPLNKIQPLLTPAGEAAWVDERGYHVRSIEPFPGSALLGPGGGMSVASASVGVGILLPALGAARQAAQQTQEKIQDDMDAEPSAQDTPSPTSAPSGPPPAPR